MERLWSYRSKFGPFHFIISWRKNLRGLSSQSQGRHNFLNLFVNIRLSSFYPKHEPLGPLKGNTLAETTMVTDCHDKKLDILVKFFLLNNHLSKSRKLSFACFAKWYSTTFYFAICTTWYVVTTMTQISSDLQSCSDCSNYYCFLRLVPQWAIIQVNNYEIVINFFISAIAWHDIQ